MYKAQQKLSRFGAKVGPSWWRWFRTCSEEGWWLFTTRRRCDWRYLRESARKVKLGGKGSHGLWWSFGTITAFQFISTENFNSLFPQNAEWSRKWSENNKNYWAKYGHQAIVLRYLSNWDLHINKSFSRTGRLTREMFMPGVNRGSELSSAQTRNRIHWSLAKALTSTSRRREVLRERKAMAPSDPWRIWGSVFKWDRTTSRKHRVTKTAPRSPQLSVTFMLTERQYAAGRTTMP